MINESFPLLRRAYAVIDGIPADRFNLSSFANSLNVHDCGTIACAAGWLGMHPEFQALGLGLEISASGRVDIIGHAAEFWDRTLSRVFGISVDQASGIFGARWMASSFDPVNEADFTDKELWQARVRRFLELNP